MSERYARKVSLLLSWVRAGSTSGGAARDALLTVCAVFPLLAACAVENPCPRGTARRGGRCLTGAAGETVTESVGAPEASVSEDRQDEPDELEPELDADVVEPEPEDDAADGERVPEVDAGAEEDARPPVMPAECADAARDVWRRFQMSEAAVPAILDCYQSEPLCTSGACDLSPCLRQAAHVDGCERCVAAEVACSAKHCAVPCSMSTDDDACRACACANGCLDAPDGCGSGDTDACADCAGASCSARLASLSDSITIPIYFHLLHEASDPMTGLPSYAVGDLQRETILDIDARLAELNELLEAARRDERRLQLIRAGVHYAPAPALDVCPEPIASSDAHRFYGGLNVVLTGPRAGCSAIAASAYAARASGATLLGVVGNMLGIAPAEQEGELWRITPAQFVAMHDYARWRLGASEAVPEAERAARAAFAHGPAAPIWDKLTNRDWALTNASVFDRTIEGPLSSLPVVESFVVPATAASRRVLGVRVSAKYTGTPSENLQVVINSQRYTSQTIGRSAIRVGGGELVVEEAYDVSASALWYQLRGGYARGTWKVSIGDSADLTLHDLRIEIILGDRSFGRYDRHARGVADIMVYRPSTSELLTATNPGDRSLAFGAPVRDKVPPLPHSQAKIFSGDVDGDGNVDLLARREASIWVSFNRRGFLPWRAGSIAGTDRPGGSDDVLMGDLDGDGFGDLMHRRADLARNQSRWSYYRGYGDGTFEAAKTPVLPGSPYPAEVVWTIAEDWRWGRSGMLARQNRQSYVVVSFNDTPEFTTSGVTPVFYGGFVPLIGSDRNGPFATERIVVLDANHDGYQDLVARRPGSGDWFVCLNTGVENFAVMQPLKVGASPAEFTDSDILLGSTL